jgi:sulfane dehydrogenase subunit SoxC
MTRSIPMSKALDDALVVYAQNGEPLRPAQGYPIRLLLPGWEGNTNIKWLRRIEVSDSPFMTREETAKYTDALPNSTARQFSVVMDTRSVITSPTFPAEIEPGWNEISGIAWSGRGRIATVEVSTDDGANWQTAELKGPLLPKAHTRFGFMWNWNGKPTVIMSRAIDETGNAQPPLATLLKIRGTPTLEAYHFNPIQAWSVDSGGQMRFRPEI